MHHNWYSEKSTCDNFVDDQNGATFITHSELNDLMGDLELCKSEAQLFTSGLQLWNFLDNSTNVNIYPSRNQDCTSENEFRYGHDIKEEEMKPPYDPKE